MKIVIATTRSFHLGHLARELIALGRDVTYLTYMPKFRIAREGLPRERARSYFERLLPWSGAALMRPAPWLVQSATEALFCYADRLYANDLPPCDIFIGLSALAVDCARVAREKYGSTVILERGSRHVLSQNEILINSGAKPLSKRYIERELAGYDLADYIALPSSHAVESFLAQGFGLKQLYKNNYGVDVELFKLSERPTNDFRLLYVGGWNRQKGCDALTRMIEACPDLFVSHVGTPGDAAFPKTSNFRSLGYRRPIDLPDVMLSHHALVLPSRQDGFGMVLLEALASGLPVIASTMTGGPDIRDLIATKDAVKIVPPADPAALAQAARELKRWLAQSSGCQRPLTPSDRDALSWSAYARRYSAFLDSISTRKAA